LIANPDEISSPCWLLCHHDLPRGQGRHRRRPL